MRQATRIVAALGMAALVAGCAAGPAGPAGSPDGAGSPAASAVAPSPAGTPSALASMSAGPIPSEPASATTSPPAPASPSANPAAEALAAQPWATAELTDVTTGETFTIASLAGKPLFVEAMAIWCHNCREQQGKFTEAFSRLLPGMAEYVVLTVDPAETASELARYKDQRGFTGRYVVAGRALSRELEAAFGPNVLNPPSVPLIFVAPDGSVEFRTGPESVQRILERAGA